MTRFSLGLPALAAGFLAVTAGFLAARAADHPGQRFQISPASLVKPYATPAAGNESLIVPRPEGAVPEVPRGFSVSTFADHLTDPRWMAVAPNGDVFLAEPKAGRITLLRDSDNNGKVDKVFTFASGFRYPHGLALHDGYLYVGALAAVWRIPYKDGQTVADAPRERVTTRVDDLRPKGNHVSRDIVFGPDGTLYLALGSKDNISDFKPGAQIFRINADGSISEFASGLRNPVGMAFAPGSNTLYATVNERDGLGDDLPPDYMTSVKPGGFYGYPYAYTGKNPDPVWGAKDPGGKIASSITPDVLFHAHSAPTGLVFYTGTNFPAEYRGDAFVSLHGSWNSGTPTGYKVVRVHFHDGKPDNSYANFVTGFWNGMARPGDPAKVWGRPVGLAVARDGALLIADDAGDVVWRVVYTGR